MAFARSGNFLYKKRGGEYIIKRLGLEARQAKAAFKADLESLDLKKAFAIAINKENKAKLQHYKTCVARTPPSMAPLMPASTDLMYSRGMDPPTILSSKTNPAPTSDGSRLMTTWPY